MTRPGMFIKVDTITFKDATALHNKMVYITDRFIIVADSETDTAPTWYNIDLIDRMDGVTSEKTPGLRIG